MSLKKIFLPILLFFAPLATLRLYAQQPKPRPSVAGNNAPPVKQNTYLDHDTNYYRAFERYITARFYVSQKYASIEMEKTGGALPVRYAPNLSFTTGVGITYQSVSINLGYTLGFLDRNSDKGRTRYLDLQGHIYGRKWTIDVLGQFYKGYYIASRGLAAADHNSYYTRPDMRVRVLGISAYRLFNPERFSFRAALLENEQQKKSAGSVLLGAEMYYGVIRADSSIVPAALASYFPQKDVSKMDFFKIGPGVGYAYTYVINEHFYLTGSLCASLNFGYNKQAGSTAQKDKIDVNKGFIYRVVAGFDQNDWNVNLSLVGNQMTVAGSAESNKYLFNAGNLKLTIARRLKPGRALRKKLQPVDKVIEDVKGLKKSKV